MTQRHAICLIVDGLRASALGAYGNTTYPTPQLDALAGRSSVVDWLWADSPQLPSFYRSVWQGKHAFRKDDTNGAPTVLERLHKSEVRQWLVTDEPWLIERSGSLPFDETLLFENDADHTADLLEETTIARFFAEAIEHLNQWREDVADSSSLAWLHCRGLLGPWDAPWAMRDELLDDEDPEAADFVAPPRELGVSDDPDELLSHRVAYAAQVAVLDACVGAFSAAVEEVFAGSESLVMLAGSRGFALGEHGGVGTDCCELYSERLHLPWLMYPCGNATPLPRLASLAQPADLGTTLLDWFMVNDEATRGDGMSYLSLLRDDVCPSRESAASLGESGEQVIRTPAWLLKTSVSMQADAPAYELYSKPDDRWESNDVAALCPEVAGELRAQLHQFGQACKAGGPLPPSL